MKILFSIICIALASCVSTKSVIDVMSAEKLKGKEDTDSTFIIKTNGEKILGVSNKFRYPSVTEKNHLINGISINIKNVVAYQDKEAYYKWYKAEKKKIVILWKD